MIKKIRIFIVLFILSFSFSVKAEVLLEIDCNDKDIDSTSSIKCDVSIYYEIVSISDIEMEYDTNLNIDFNEVDGFSLTKNDNKINIHPSTPLYDEIGFSSKIFEITLKSNENLNDKESLTFKNIKINNNSSEIISSVSETFNIIKKKVELDNINTLDVITVNDSKVDDTNPFDTITSDDKIVDNFDKDILEYNISVQNEIVRIKAVRTSPKSSVEGLGDIRVAPGEKISRQIRVIAENGDVRVYILNITNITEKKKEKLSDDNTLKSVELLFNKEKIDFKFDSKIDTYDIKVKESIDKLKIVPETSNNKASFAKKYGPRDIKLKYGDNKFEIKVIAEDTSSKIYTFNIYREDERSDDATLKSLSINGQEIILGDSNHYEVTLGSDILKTDVIAYANNSKASVKYENITLKDGVNDIKINVTAENGDEKEYHIDVIREDEKIYFDKIEIKDYDLKFNKDIHEYNLKIDNSTDKLDIKVYPSDISHKILNNENLTDGSKITIQILEDNNNLEYTINISKDNPPFNIICLCVFILGIVLLILSIIRLIIKKMNK